MNQHQAVINDGTAFYFIPEKKSRLILGVYTQSELLFFLQTLSNALLNYGSDILLSIQSTPNAYVDTARIHYHAETQTWKLITIENEEIDFGHDTAALSRALYKLLCEFQIDFPYPTDTTSSYCMTTTSNVVSPEFVIFSTKVFEQKHKQNTTQALDQVIDTWQSSTFFRLAHDITKKKARAFHAQHKTSLLHLAVINNQFDLTETLLKKGAFPNQANNEGYRPLHLLMTDEHLNIARLLLKYGADPNCLLPPFQANAQEVAYYRANETLVSLLTPLSKTHIPTYMRGLWLLDRLKLMGYPSNLGGGTCHGYGGMGGYTILARQLNHFQQRMMKLYQTPRTHFIDFNKKKPSERLSFLNQSQPFLNGIVLHQAPSIFSSYFVKNKPNHQCFFHTNKLVEPILIEQEGGIVELDSFSDVHTFQELMILFSSLHDTLHKHAENAPFFFLMGTSDHRITVSFDLINQEWIIINTSTMPLQRIKDLTLFVKEIHFGLSLIRHTKLRLLHSITIYCTKQNEASLSPVFNAWKALPVFQRIHAITEEKLSFRDRNHYNLLMLCTFEKQFRQLSKLLSYGANPHEVNIRNLTAFHEASQQEDASSLKLLLTSKQHASFPVEKKKALYGELLNYAVTFHAIHCAKLLLQLPETDPNFRNKENESTALHVASYKNHVEMIQLLLEHHADPLLTNKAGFNALKAAVENEQPDVECVKYLLRHIDDIDVIYDALFTIRNKRITLKNPSMHMLGVNLSQESYVKTEQEQIDELLTLHIQLHRLSEKGEAEHVSFGLFSFSSTPSSIETIKMLANKLKQVMRGTASADSLSASHEEISGKNAISSDLKKMYEWCLKYYPERFNLSQSCSSLPLHQSNPTNEILSLSLRQK